ncbi:MAG: FAD-binding protein, partial [Oscillospiraceae bacterium]|nr:FAD-binding protein [Oscillospiraceae bacterium]
MREIAQALPNIEVRGGEPMSLHTSLRIGGTVRAMVFPKTEGELIESGRALRRMRISPLLIGAGTNLLVSDAALDIVVIRTVPGVGELKILGERSDRLVFASCGVTLPRLSAFARDNGLGGAEFMHGIPGSVGGAVCMNAGAYGSEMSDIVRLVTAQSEDGKVFDTAGQDCGFSYRHSGYADDNSVVLSVVIELIDKEPDDIRRDMQKYD